LREESNTQADAELVKHAARETAACFEEFARLVKAGMDVEDFQTRVKILRLLIQRVEVDEREIQIVYKADPLPFELTPVQGVAQNHPRRIAVPVPVKDLEAVAAAEVVPAVV
jgi:hypothetical protein